MADTKSLVVIDEAYIDFGGNSCIEVVEKPRQSYSGSDLFKITSIGRAK